MKNLEKLLKKHGYTPVEKITQDEFGRFHAFLNRKSKKFFLKAITNKSEYGYMSLKRESKVSSVLSQVSHREQIKLRGKTFLIPKVEEIIEEQGLLCLISEFIEGKRLLDQSSEIIVENITEALGLLNILSGKVDINTLKPWLASYSAKKLLFFTPFRVVKAAVLAPKNAIQIIKAGVLVLKVLKRSNYNIGLVHADLNASNVILKRKKVYITDWEEAGWGILEYNMTTPLCVQFELFNEKNIGPVSPLFAYRVLSLLNQNVGKNSKKRKRDLKLLEFVQKL